MTATPFAQRVAGVIAATRSVLCVGLDPGIEQVGDVRGAERHCREVLEAALPHSAAVKPNSAFFEQFGSAGVALLERLRGWVPDSHLLILDAKRGDIGNTAAAYARFAFDVLGADAVTVNPLLGGDSVAPFLAHRGRGVLVLTRTSNPGAADLLEQRLESGTPVYMALTALALEWDRGRGDAGLVVGATAPAAIAEVRTAAPGAVLLIPGVGSQGGAVEESVAAAGAGGAPFLVNISRGIAGAAEGPAVAAQQWHARLEAARAAAVHG